MSGLLWGAGGLAFVVGALLVGFGIPINEFSFGNTLIVAGTTAAVGGMITVALGFVLAQLQRLTEALAVRSPPVRSQRPMDMFEAAPGRAVAFPPKPKADVGSSEAHSAPAEAPAPFEKPAEQSSMRSFAPTLPNPDESPVTVDDEVSLSPQHPMASPAAAPSDVSEPPLPTPLRAPQNAYFDAMWPADPKPAKTPIERDTETVAYVPTFDPPLDAAIAEPEMPAPEAHAVAILKSGVVDGMGYTLYVDGSIEAELPQGTLRFATINELRSHLENND